MPIIYSGRESIWQAPASSHLRDDYHTKTSGSLGYLYTMNFILLECLSVYVLLLKGSLLWKYWKIFNSKVSIEFFYFCYSKSQS